MNVVYVRFHDEEAVRTLLDQAYEIACGRSSDPSEWTTIFQAAVALLSAGHALVQQPMPVNLDGLGIVPRPGR